MRNYLLKGEIDRVLAGLKMPYKLVAEMMVWTGRRPTEVLMIQRGDIDHERKKIAFLQLKKRGKKIDYPMGKGKYDRVYERKKVVMPTDCSAFYDKLIKYLKSDHWSDYIFPSSRRGDKHITIRALQKKVKKAGEEVQLSVHPHMFRHSFAVQYLDKKINVDGIDAIQALFELKNHLGHSSIDTTMGYLAYVTGNEKLKDLWNEG